MNTKVATNKHHN